MSIKDEILNTIGPLLSRHSKSEPAAHEPGYYLDVFVALAVEVGLDDKFNREEIVSRVAKAAQMSLAEVG